MFRRFPRRDERARRGDPPFVLWYVLLEGKDLQPLLGAPFAQHVEQVGFSGLQRPARHLQVVVAERNRLGLLPLVVEHVDGDLRQQRRRRSDFLFIFLTRKHETFPTRSEYGGRRVPNTIQRKCFSL